jgi:hypothetical protein
MRFPSPKMPPEAALSAAKTGTHLAASINGKWVPLTGETPDMALRSLAILRKTNIPSGRISDDRALKLERRRAGKLGNPRKELRPPRPLA